MYDVVTVGSAIVDAFSETDRKFLKKGKFCFPVGAKLLIKNLNFHVGGGGTNTGVGFSRLGLRTGYIGKIGRGTNSERILKCLIKEKIDTSLICRENGRTGFSVVLDAKGSDRTILIFRGSNNHLDFKEIKLSKVKTKWIYSSSMTGKSFYALGKLFGWAYDKGIKIVFNPSSYQCSKGVKFLGKMLKRLEILILNSEEAKLLVKKKGVKDLLKGLHKLGPKIVVITEGAKGAHCFDGEKFYFAKTHDVRIVETTGAGDAFGCGFATGMIKKGDIKFALSLGTTNAESVIQYIGAKNKLLKWEEALNVMKRRPVKVI